MDTRCDGYLSASHMLTLSGMMRLSSMVPDSARLDPLDFGINLQLAQVLSATAGLDRGFRRRSIAVLAFRYASVIARDHLRASN